MLEKKIQKHFNLSRAYNFENELNRSTICAYIFFTGSADRRIGFVSPQIMTFICAALNQRVRGHCKRNNKRRRSLIVSHQDLMRVCERGRSTPHASVGGGFLALSLYLFCSADT